jgi:CO/xanthine dehydrogenase Mo-binding subunit
MEHAVVGKNVPKIDALEKALGKAIYINDITFPGMLYGKILRSPFPHARIIRIDVSEAQGAPGVKAVIAADDLPDGRYGPFIKDEPVLARDKVRYIGEPVAAVAATDLDAAEEALGLIDVEYEELPAVFDPEEAMKPDTPLIHENLKSYLCVFQAIQEGNICSKTIFTEGDVKKGLREADVVVEESFKTHMHHQAYIEPCGAIATMDPSGKFTVWSSSQGVFITQARIAESLKVPMSKIRVIGPRVGGAFGGKVETHVQPICVALAQKTMKPVKIVLTREEEFSATRPRHPATMTCKLGVKKDGTIVAKEMVTIFDTGAYSCDGPGVTGFGSLMARGPYRVPNLKIEGYCVYTNKVKAGAFRGFGNPQTAFASESVMDIAARQIGMDPLDFRLKNALDPGNKSLGGQVLKSVGIKECLNKAAETIQWKDAKKGKWRGKGIASIVHISGLVSGTAFVRINEDGTVSLQIGNMDIGQGSDTVMCQICAEELGVSMEDIALLAGDTAATAYTWATAASRTTWTAGNAVRRAAENAKNQLFQLAADQLGVDREALEMKERKIFLKKDPDKGLTFQQLGAISCWVKGGPVVGKESFMVEEPAFDRSGFQGFPFGTMTAYIFAAQTAEVEVDVETGEVSVIRGSAAHDVGHAINPQNVEGQIEGGYVQGLGYALIEKTVFDGGKVMNPSFADYKILPAVDVPDLKPIIVEAFDKTGPFGAKGVGEPGLVGVAPAVANAIFDAIGVRMTELPITPENILEKLRSKNSH